MHLHPDHLLALACVARTGSLTQAARLLGKTQPAISAQIKLLAEAVGEPLLTRHRYGVDLTPAGKALLPPAQTLARSLEIAEEVSERLRGINHGILRVRTSTSVAVYFLPPMLALFHERHPSVELQLQYRNADDALHDLDRNDADVAVVRGPVGPISPNLVSSLLLTDETILAVLPDHPLAARTDLRMEDLDGLEIVSRGSDSPTRKLVESLASRNNISLRVKFEVNSIEAIKEAVLQGFGGGFLSRLAVAREVKFGTLAAVSLHDPALLRSIMLIHAAANQVSPRVRAFLDALAQGLPGGFNRAVTDRLPGMAEASHQPRSGR